MEEAKRNICIRAINHFGVEAQTNKAIEEMAELMVELSRRGSSRYDKTKVAEEIADAMIMLEQMRIIYGGAKVDAFIDAKLERLDGKLSGDRRRQERMMPKGMIVHRSESLACYEVGKAAVAGFEAGLNEEDPKIIEKVKTATEIVEEGERRRFELLHRGEVVKPKPCCLDCKHLRPAQFDGVRGARCDLSGEKIIGKVSEMRCGRFESVEAGQDE